MVNLYHHRQPQVLFAFACVSPFCAFQTRTHLGTLTHSFIRSLAYSHAHSFAHPLARSLTHTYPTCIRRTLVDYLTRTRARPVTWPPIAKDVCGTAKSVRGGRPVEKERIETRSGGREGGKGRNGGGDTGSGIPPGVSGSSLF